MRTFFLLCIACVPFSVLKRFLYRIFFGYHIDGGTRIGFCLLDARSVTIGKNCRLHSFVMVRRLKSFRLGDNVILGSFNLFPASIQSDFYQNDFFAGDQVYISRSHRFDMSANIYIDQESVIGGVSGSFWTHGAWREHLPIHIGKKCFISDAVQILPGTRLNDNTLVGAAAVVAGNTYPPDSLILGNPASVVKENFIWWQKKETDKEIESNQPS